MVAAANSIAPPCMVAFAPASRIEPSWRAISFGGIVVCEDRDLIAEEAPEAYKSIDRVVADLADFGLARVGRLCGPSSP